MTKLTRLCYSNNTNSRPNKITQVTSINSSSVSHVVCREGCNAVHLSKRSSVLKGPTRGLGKCCTLQKVKSLLEHSSGAASFGNRWAFV